MIIGMCSLEETNCDHYVIIQGVVKGTENGGRSTFFEGMKESFQRKINFRTKNFILCEIFSDGARPA